MKDWAEFAVAVAALREAGWRVDPCATNYMGVTFVSPDYSVRVVVGWPEGYWSTGR